MSALTLCDSLSPGLMGTRLTTMLLRCPRMILPELLTHRSFSRSTESSRAVNSVKRASLSVYTPTEIGKDCKGMQRKENLTGIRKLWAKAGWGVAILGSRVGARMMRQAGTHKQHANRPLDWCGYVEVIVTGDSEAWENFLTLRDHEDAQPEMQELAKEVKHAYSSSTPTSREFHIPYDIGERFTLRGRINASAGYCAGISFLNHGKAEWQKAEMLGHKLKGHTPAHLSPYEHQALSDKCFPQKYYNLRGWKNYRYLITECQDDLPTL